MRARTRRGRRPGAAAVEFLFVTTFVLLPIVVGLWEVGRLIIIQNVLSNAAREGARLAAQSVTISSDGSQTKILTTINPGATPPSGWTWGDPNVKAAVFQALHAAGYAALEWDDVEVAFKYLDEPELVRADGTKVKASEGPSTVSPNPHTGVKGQRFSVKARLTPGGFNKIRWSNRGTAFGMSGPPIQLVPTNGLEFTVEWRMMVDLPFSVNTTLPKW